MTTKTPDEDELLVKWEEVHKKGLLSFWILLRLHDEPGYAYDIARSIEGFSQSTMSADENSIYRALGRFESLGILASEVRESESGPDRRYYSLTERGRSLLRRFIERNILVFEAPEVSKRIRIVLNGVLPKRRSERK